MRESGVTGEGALPMAASFLANGYCVLMLIQEPKGSCQSWYVSLYTVGGKLYVERNKRQSSNSFGKREVDLRTNNRWETKGSLHGWGEGRLDQYSTPMAYMEGAFGLSLRLKWDLWVPLKPTSEVWNLTTSAWPPRRGTLCSDQQGWACDGKERDCGDPGAALTQGQFLL